MNDIQEQTVSAFNEYFETLKNAPDVGDINVLVWQFSDTMDGREPKVRPLHDGPLAQVPTLGPDNYRPRGNTPLLDAIGTAILQTQTKQADRYLFVVQTDGLENASREFTREQIAKMVSEKEASANWTMVFLGAGIDNWRQEARGMGVRGQSVTAYATTDTSVAYASLASASSAMLRTNTVKATDLGEKTEEEIKRRKEQTPSS